MIQKNFLPPPFLNHFVRSIQILECDDSSSERHSLGFFADGSPGIMCHISAEDFFLGEINRNKCEIILYGQTTKPIEVNASGTFRIIIFTFYPHIIKSLFGFDSTELTDNCLDLTLLPSKSGIHILEHLQNALSAEDQINIINHYLINLVKLNESGLDNSIHYAISHILNLNGQASLGELRKQLHTSERTFERKFSSHVGISPKLFARICQFQSAIFQIRNQYYTKLSDVAYDNGYSDQSHLIRSFKQFIGISPLKFQKQLTSQLKYPNWIVY